MKVVNCSYSFLLYSIFLIICSCSASNCPLESNVTCNYGLYDSNGNPIVLNDELTVTTLLPGYKTVYIYKQLNAETVTLDYQDDSYLERGYSLTISNVRKDTVLINKITNVNTLKIPLSYFAEKDTIILSYASISNKDTIYLQHNNYTHVDLPECGTNRFHTLKNISSTYSGINDVEIVNSTVNYEGNENVKIYFNGTAE